MFALISGFGSMGSFLKVGVGVATGDHSLSLLSECMHSTTGGSSDVSALSGLPT
jgi:hypothetical protein